MTGMRGMLLCVVWSSLPIILSGCLREKLLIDDDVRVVLANDENLEVWAPVNGKMRKGWVWRPAGTMLVSPRGGD